MNVGCNKPQPKKQKIMNTHVDKTQENKSQAVTNAISQKQIGGESTFQFVDNRPETIAQRKLQEMANNSPQVSQLKAFQEMANNSPQVNQAAQLQSMADNFSSQQQQPIQKKENNTGLPDNLKTGMENLSGMSLDDVKVHRNSDKPAQLQAHAYAQGTDIHLGAGQEKHLPHEAWHVVQQKQGRVKPTMQMKGKVNVNDDKGLEREADVMGAKALNTKGSIQNKKNGTATTTIQRVVTKSGSSDIERFHSDKVENENSEDGNFDTKEAASAAEKERLRGGLGLLASMKARVIHKFNKKVRKDGSTLEQEQNKLLNQEAVEKEQGKLRYVAVLIKGASSGAKAAAKVAGTALGGPAGTAVGFALSYGIGWIEKAATASLNDKLQSAENQSYAIIGSDKDNERADYSEQQEEDEPQGYIDEGSVIRDEGKRSAALEAMKRMAKKIESYSKEQIKKELDPQPINANLLLKGSPEEVASSLLWEGIKLGIGKGLALAEGKAAEAAAKGNAKAYRKLINEDE
jgi:hypothetical protein